MSATAGRISSMVPNGSAVPWVNTVGTVMRGRCSVRARSGLPGGCSGYENTVSTSSSSAVGDRHRGHAAAVRMAAGDDAVRRRERGRWSGLDDSCQVGGRRARRRTFRLRRRR